MNEIELKIHKYDLIEKYLYEFNPSKIKNSTNPVSLNPEYMIKTIMSIINDNGKPDI